MSTDRSKGGYRSKQRGKRQWQGGGEHRVRCTGADKDSRGGRVFSPAFADNRDSRGSSCRQRL